MEIDERVAAADEIEEDDEDGADGDMFDELALGGYKAPMKQERSAQRRNFTLTLSLQSA